MDEGLLARLLPTFREEAEEHLQAIEDALLRLERAPDPPAVDAMFRAAHSLKGGAAALGLVDLEKVAHALEEALGTSRQAGALAPGLADAALHAVDVARASLRAHADEGPAGDVRVEPAVELLQHAAAAAPAGPPDEAPRPAAHGPAGGEPPQRGTRVSPDVLEALSALAAASGEVLARAAQRLPEIERSASLLDEGERARLLGTLHGLDADLLELATETGTANDLLAELREVDAREVFAPVRRLVRDLARRQGKEVWLRVRGSDVELSRALADGLREALVHLVRNAIDHGAEAPAQRQAAGKPPACTISVSAALKGGELFIAVEDDGAGLDVAALQAAALRAGVEPAAAEAGLETAFLSGVSTRADAGLVSGRGIGLFAVRERIEELGGSVKIESTQGKFTRVTLALPRRPGARISHRRARVVVADDSAATRALYRSLLEAAGYVVETAADGAEAEALAASADLVISDVSMPRMNGIELARRVGGRVPLIIVSATASDEEMRRGIEAGARGYYSKRVLASDALLRVVGDALAGTR
jgi:two-component system chemotaxis sensor kinase CheA